MAVQRTYKEKLYNTLIVLEKNRWFRIDNHKEFEKISKTVKKFIDNNEPFEFSTDYTKIRRIHHYE